MADPAPAAASRGSVSLFDPWRHRLSLLTSASTLALIFVGGLVTSTESAEADFAAARAAGANFYLVKPVEREQLVQFARMLCGVPP